MTLKEIAQGYRDAAVPLSRRLKELRLALKATDDPDEIWSLKRRIAELVPMLTQCNKLADLCEHYYEPGYYHDDYYCFSSRARKKGAYGSEDKRAYKKGYGEEQQDLYSN